MRTQNELPHQSRPYIAELDNHILVENNAGGVVISATRDNFSDKRKAFFVRHLAAEGYILERYEWFSEPVEDGFLGVKWIASASSDENEARFHSFRKLCTPVTAATTGSKPVQTFTLF